ncbi:MAG TPA: O-acetyl-ADP-ribose deacetylase [candidate division Zixibacteria bacterium]|nr:O-acetyl-ADP-ribose deacetylase [candidate division Zixibacteria bacterium]
MPDELQVNDSKVRLVKGDITDIDVDSFVYYAREDLSLGSGYGNAIAMRGGPAIQDELKELGPKGVTEVVITSAGNMKARKIIHAVGPKFQEEELPHKMRKTIINALKLADEQGIKQVSFPAMGAGFYGVPLEESAELTLSTIKDYLQNGSRIQEVIICLLDTREYLPFQKKLNSIQQA